MDVQKLKEYISENNYVELILQELNCHHIKYHSSGYFTCGNPDGDNPVAIVTYIDSFLLCEDYTRQLTNANRKTDLIDLICYFKNCNFPDALKFICNLLDLEYYHNFDEDVPESLLITDLVLSMSSNIDIDKEKPLKPISKTILSYYKPYVNDLFYNDGINYETQKEFEIGYDEYSNRITIPIYSELGDLVGVKGRLLKNKLSDDDLKYLYLEPCARSRILFGLNKTINYIKQSGKVYVLEAEKAPMQLWSHGYYNSVATGGKELSNHQIEMLVRLGVDIILCLDKDVTKQEIEDLANRFPDGVPIYYMFDENNILNEKEAPTDNIDKWKILEKNNIYRMR